MVYKIAKNLLGAGCFVKQELLSSILAYSPYPVDSNERGVIRVRIIFPYATIRHPAIVNDVYIGEMLCAVPVY